MPLIRVSLTSYHLMNTRVKICGITRVEDARQAVALGVDAIGLVFWSGSSRAVSTIIASDIAVACGPFVTTVGLFVDPEPEEVGAVLESVPLDVLQFHGNEPAALCRRFGRPYIKAVSMRNGRDVGDYASAYPDAMAYLLDTHVEGLVGGTGQAFDWSRAPVDLHKPVILAGGLSVDNVANAIAETRPYAVDVSSGVERTKGTKDSAKMAAFVNEVNRVNSNS